MVINKRGRFINPDVKSEFRPESVGINFPIWDKKYMCNETSCCKSKCVCKKIRNYLLIIGGINWGLYGVGMLMSSNWNVVNLLLGQWPTIEAIVYILVGITALMKIFGFKCKKCVTTCASCCEVSDSSKAI